MHYIHTYVHTYIHALHTYIHTYIHTYMHYIHTYNTAAIVDALHTYRLDTYIQICTSAVSNILRAPSLIFYERGFEILRAPSFLFYERGFEILRAPSFICYERGFEILRAPFHTFYERRHFCFTSAVFQFYERRFNRRSIFLTSAVLNACLWNLPYVIVIMFYERGNDRVRLVFDDFLFLRARMATNPGL